MEIYQAVITIITIWLLLPILFKKRQRLPLSAPNLSEFEYQEVQFENQNTGIQLAGMLFLPQDEDPCPTARIIHGSGSSRRKSVWDLSIVKKL